VCGGSVTQTSWPGVTTVAEHSYLRYLTQDRADAMRRAQTLREAAELLTTHKPSSLSSTDDYRSGWAAAVSALEAIAQVSEDTAASHQASIEAYQRGLSGDDDRG
jgi:hypothetical protein